MDVHLNERFVTNAAEAVDLTGLDDEDVARSGFELLSVDCPEATPSPHELHFIVGMAVRSGTAPGKGAKQEDGDVDIPVIDPDELVRAPLKGQVFLSHAIHLAILQ